MFGVMSLNKAKTMDLNQSNENGELPVVLKI